MLPKYQNHPSNTEKQDFYSTIFQGPKLSAPLSPAGAKHLNATQTDAILSLELGNIKGICWKLIDSEKN